MDLWVAFNFARFFLILPNQSPSLLLFLVAVVKHYEDYHDDQFDFHNYCIRKVTLRSYCKLLKFEDELWGLPHYCRAAEGIISIHLQLVDNAANSKQNDELDYSDMTPAERKKAKNLARKKKKADGGSGDGGGGGGGGKDGMLSKTNTDGSGNKKKSTKPHVIDEDPEGKELVALDHLNEAKKFAAILVRHCPKRMPAWALQYDVSIRRGKMLLAMQVRDFFYYVSCLHSKSLYIILYVLCKTHNLSTDISGTLQNEIN